MVHSASILLLMLTDEVRVPSGIASLEAVLLLASISALVLCALAWWRARPSHGEARGLPPGSLGLITSLRALREYDFYRRQIERHGPVFKMSQYHRPVACVVGLRRAREVLQRHRAELSPAPLFINRYTSGGLLRYMGPEQHQTYRRWLRSCMTPQVVRACEPFVAEQARLGFAAMARSCRAEGVGLQPHVDELAFVVCARVFLGLEPEDGLVPVLQRLYGVIDYQRPWLSRAKTREQLAELVALVRGQAGRLGDGSGSRCFLGEAVHHEADLIDDPVFVENLAYFLHIARSDLTGLIGWLLKMLVDHPEPGLQIREDASQADRFVAETLRLRQSEYIYRTATGPVRVDGHLIPPGWLIRFCIRESHTDPAVFEDPLRFDPDRFLRSWSQDEYQPFGMHDHACLGVQMTRTVSRICLETLVSQHDWALVSDGPMELGLQHHRHWKPSSRFRLRLSARA